MNICACNHHRGDHGEKLASKRPVRFVPEGCIILDCRCEKYEEKAAEGATMPSEREKFARALIGQQQQIILKSQRIIEDVKREFGLKE